MAPSVSWLAGKCTGNWESPMRMLTKAAPLAISLLLFSVPPALGQSILVHVVASESGEPISGVFVSLLNEQGGVLRSALTGESGRFLFPVREPGVFRVRAEMIGRETKLSPPVVVRAGEPNRVALSLSFRAIPMAGIQVQADGRCRLRPDEASEIARVWEEARTALAVQQWTEEEGLYQLEVVTYDRDLDTRARRVERENRSETTVVTRIPFVSLPPEDLLTGGFVRPLEDGGYQYYGPDAQVLLSDLFLDKHCLKVTRSGDLPGSIGLAFEPVERDGPSDIQGTLWLDESTAGLQFLEYEYTWAPYREAQGIGGGRVEFQAMPNGAWIIDRWWIRAPIMTWQPYLARGGNSGVRLTAIRETGGEVIGARTLDQQRISEAERGSLTGLVWDSTQTRPLEGAVVQLLGTEYAAVTDADGRFRMNEVLGGVFTANFTHPRLDSLNIEPPAVEIGVTPGRISELRLSIPSLGTILLGACRAEARETGVAVVSGTVIDRSSGKPIPGAMVRVEWQEGERSSSAERPAAGRIDVQASAEGSYTACGIPLGAPFQIQASFLDQTSLVVRGEFEAEEHRLLDLGIDLPARILAGRTADAQAVEEYGAQGVQGVLVEPESGDPVRGAELTLRDGSGRIAATGVSDQRGFFRLRAPVPGRYILSAQALGFAEVEDEVVEVALGQLAVLEVQMPPDALELEPLVVTAERRNFHLEMEGFYDRQRVNGGIFLSPETLEKRRPSQLTDLFFGMPGTFVTTPLNGVGARGVYFQRGLAFGGICWPMVYVDWLLVSEGGGGGDPGAVDEAARPGDVAAIEVYRSSSQVPAQFQGAHASCGVIVIWTHRGGGG